MELKIKLKWLYGFFSQTVYEHLLPVNYTVSKEGISRYGFNRNLFEIIKWRIMYHPGMNRGWNGKFVLMGGEGEKWCENQTPDRTWKEMLSWKRINVLSHCTCESFSGEG